MALTWGSTNLSYAFIIYILISITQGLFIAKYMYMQNKPVSALITTVLLILVFYFFGKRWFQYGQLKGTTGWIKANALAQSGSISTTPISSTGLAGVSKSPSTCNDPPSTASPSVWPPIINHCPDFMTLQTDRSCKDTAKLYGTTEIGKTVVESYTGHKNVCPSVSGTPSKNQYLRWEGVVQAEGSCFPGNIGKPPST
jgi:hypothetical protein